MLDPEVQTLSTLTNVQNSLFVPNVGHWLNRRPTYNLSQHDPEIGQTRPLLPGRMGTVGERQEAEAEAEAATPAKADTESETEQAPPVATPGRSTPERSNTCDSDPMDVTVNITPETPQRHEVSHTVSEPLPIRNAASGAGRSGQIRDSRTPSPPGMTNGAEGPITPRNNVGPWVFDGSAGRAAAPTSAEMTSIDAAAEVDLSADDKDSSSR